MVVGGLPTQNTQDCLDVNEYVYMLSCKPGQDKVITKTEWMNIHVTFRQVKKGIFCRFYCHT